MKQALADLAARLRQAQAPILAGARALPSLRAVAKHDSDAKVRAAAEQGLRTIGEPR